MGFAMKERQWIAQLMEQCALVWRELARKIAKKIHALKMQKFALTDQLLSEIQTKIASSSLAQLKPALQTQKYVWMAQELGGIQIITANFIPVLNHARLALKATFQMEIHATRHA